MLRLPEDVLPAHIVVIETRPLIGECLARCVSAEFGCPVVSFPDVESWQKASSDARTALIILDVSERSEDQHVHEAICELQKLGNGAPVVVFSDAEDIDHVRNSLRSGARGHVPTSTALDVAMKAIRLVLVGGVFVPANTFLSGQRLDETDSGDNQWRAFTTRQKAVVDALRKGKANKLIAHELNMSESTVKFHVSSLMKKLHAKNRTEVAIKVGETENCD